MLVNCPVPQEGTFNPAPWKRTGARTDIDNEPTDNEDFAMSLPTRWNPFRQSNRFEALPDIEDIFRGFGMRSMGRDTDSLDMRMNVNEDKKSYRVTVDMPGVKKEDIDVSVQGNQVSITAEVTREDNRDNERELYSERYVGRAYRSFSLPSDIDGDQAEASYESGVLTLTLPKKAGTETRRLSVN